MILAKLLLLFRSSLDFIGHSSTHFWKTIFKAHPRALAFYDNLAANGNVSAGASTSFSDSRSASTTGRHSCDPSEPDLYDSHEETEAAFADENRPVRNLHATHLNHTNHPQYKSDLKQINMAHSSAHYQPSFTIASSLLGYCV